MADRRIQYTLGFDADTSKAKAQMRELQNELNKLTNVKTNGLGINKEIFNATASAKELQQALQHATNVDTGKLDLSVLSKSLKASGKTIKDYAKDFQNLGPQGQQAFRSITSAIVQSEAPLKRTNKLLDEMAVSLSNTIKWQLSSSAVHGFMGAIQGAYGYAQDLNKSLNDIRIVTGQSTDQMAEFAKQANNSAKALSTSTVKYTEAALIYYQQGLNDEQVKARTDTTVKMANVTGENAADVSSYMTAIWNNFAKGSDNLEYFSDVITALGAATAASSEEIAGGLEKFAAVGETVGLSYEYATAALTTIIDKTRQSEDVVGTALKTIFARIQGLQQGDTAEDGVTLNKYSKALENVGIQIMDTSGELKAMDDILNELGQRWQTLSKAEQVALAQTVGGTRQYTQLIALMDNWGAMQENLSTAYNSSGSLEEQAEIYAESWEAAQKRVTASLETIYQQLLNDKFFIGISNLFADGIDLVSKFIDTIGGLPGVLAVAGAAFFTLFKDKIPQIIGNATDSLRYMSGAEFADAKAIRTEALNEQNKMLQMDLTDTGIAKYNTDSTYATRLAQLESLEQLDEAAIKNLRIKIELEKEYGEVAVETSKKLDEKHVNTLNKEENFKDVFIAEELHTNESLKDKDKKTYGQIQAESNKIIADIKAGDLTKDNLTDPSNKFSANQQRAIAAYIDALNEEKIVKEKLNKETNELNKIRQENNDKLEMSIEEQQKYNKKIQESLSEEEKIKIENKKVLDNTQQGFIKAAQGITSFTMGVTSLGNAFKVLNDDSLGFFEKIERSLPSLIMGIPTLINGLKSLKGAYDLLHVSGSKGLALKAAEILLGNAWIAEQGKEITLSMVYAAWKEKNNILTSKGIIVKTADLVITKLLDVANKSLLASFGLLAVGIAAVVAIGAGLVALWKWLKDNSPEGQLKKANEELENSRKAAQEASNAYNDLKSSIDSLESAQNTLSNLTKGTLEWKEAILKVNQQVLDLIEKYPELAQYMTTDSDGVLGFKEGALDTVLQQQLNEATATQAAVLSDQRSLAELKNSQKNKLDNVTFTTFDQYSRQQSTKILGTNAQIAMLNNAEKVGAFNGEKIDFYKLAKEMPDLYSDFLLYQNAINDTVPDILAMREAIKQTDLEMQKMDENIAKNWLASHETEYGDDYNNLLASGMSKYIGDARTSISQQITNNSSELKEAYAKLMLGEGASESSIQDYIKKIDEKIKNDELNIKTIKETLIDTAANYQAFKQIEGNVSAISNFENVNGYEILKKIAISGGSEAAYNAMTPDELKEFKSSFFEGEELKEDVAKLFNENPQIFGENFASQLQNALNDPEYADKAKINQEKAFSQKAEQKAAGLGVDADALEAYAKNLQDINPLLKDNADAALDAAEANIKWNNGIEKLSEVLDNNAEALKKSNKGTWAYYEALGKVQDAVSNLLGINVSIEYTEKHLADLQKAVKGDEEAIRKLQQTAAVDWAGEFVKGLQDVGKEGEEGFFDADAWTKQFTSIVDEAANILGGLDTNVELTADANGVLSAADESVAAMVNLANEAMAAGQMTEAEMREMFGSMGYSPEVTYEDAQQTTTTHGTFRLGGELIGMDIPYSNTVVQDIKVPKIADKNNDGKTSLTKITTPKSLAKTATPKGKASGGSSSKKDKKNADDEIERYHEIRETIQSLEKELDRLSKAKDRAYGQDKLDLMDKEIAKVEELKSAQEEYLKQIRANYNKDRAAAAAIGAKFDEQGNISNWDEIRKKALDKFNNSGRTDKDEEKYNRIKEILDQYEETHDLLMEEEDKLDDYINQIMDMKIAKIQYKVEVKVDIEEKELEYLDYLLSKLENEEFAAAETMALLGQQTQSWLDKYKANAEGLYDTINKLGISLNDAIGIMTGKYIKEEIDALGLTEEQLKIIREYGVEFINIAQALDQLKDSFTQELIDAIHEGADAYAQLGEEINHVTSTLQHYQNLIDILGEEALGIGAKEVAELMQSTVDSSIVNLANSQKSLEWLKSERERLTAALKGASDAEKESIKKTLEDLDDQIRSAESQAQSDLESVLNIIVEQFTLHVKQATDAFEKAISGTFGSLDKLQEAFDRQKELDDLYIDDYKKVYELTKLTRDIGKSIDETDNLKAKQALRDLQKEINDLQKDGIQLSEYDIDMLNKKYELQLAQIALEEAQNAKSQVRMTRDSEGNWSYTYTADENNIAEAEQNYEDKLYAMQELNQEYLKNLQGQILAAQAAMSQAIRDLGPNAGPEEVAAITQHYQAIIDAHSQQMQNALSDSNYALGFMTEETEGWVNDFDETTLSTMTGFESLEFYQAAFAQSTQQMADDIGKAFETYNINVNKAMETAGLSVEGFGETLGKVQEQAKEDLDEITEDSELLSKDVTKNVGDALAQLQEFYDTYGASVESATDETWGLVEALKALSKAQAQQDQEKPEDKPKNQKPEQDSSKPTWEKVKSAYDKINSGAWGTGHQRVVDGKADGFTEAEISLAQKLINKVYGGMSLSDAKKAIGFATGGYTGAWGSSGRLAMLHEKELVLNPEDTINMLKTIDMVRDISNLIDLNAANSMFSTLTTMAMPVGNQGITQEITINAEFPDATDRDEISAAFDNLFIRASQYANRKIQ